MGAGYPKDQAKIRSLEFSAHPTPAPKMEEGLEIEWIIDYAFVRKPYLRSSQISPCIPFHLAVHLYTLSYLLINWHT